MTILAAHVPSRDAQISLDAIKVRAAGRTLGELLAIRDDLAGRINQHAGPNEWHDRTVSEGSSPGDHRMFRDIEMERLARLRAEHTFITDLIARGGIT